jgi:hypothetical protein
LRIGTAVLGTLFAGIADGIVAAASGWRRLGRRTDRRTDGRTDGRNVITGRRKSPAEISHAEEGFYPGGDEIGPVGAASVTAKRAKDAMSVNFIIEGIFS